MKQCFLVKIQFFFNERFWDVAYNSYICNMKLSFLKKGECYYGKQAKSEEKH